ncbi:MAG TPA: PQQ-binding-like beta-propeller repeat protein [Alphaproteobacteria bacterium]|nr:PQQ-binding-like beta-propeller repeat protein [Alphaproteobacteria bacterium]
MAIRSRLLPILLAATCLAAPLAAVAADHASKSWPMVEGDLGNSRYSTLKQIDTKNIKELGAVWNHKFEGEVSRGTPIVVDGVMYVTAGSHVYALNAKTGEQIWAHKTEIAPSFQFKGITLAEGKVFYGTADAHIVALDAKTGNEVWSHLIGDNMPIRADSPAAALTLTGQYVSGAPTYADGKIITGLSNGDFGVRGRVVALDAKTGNEVWTFYAIPGPNDIGGESWPKNDEWKRGGGGVWNTPVVDKELGLVIFGTGNPVPQWGGELRGGDNLFTDSVVAVDLKTGKYKWHYQTVHHDIWEDDIGTPLVLYDATVDGKPRKAVGAMRTDGYLFLLDRATGKPVFPVEERPQPQAPRQMTAPTQPFPVGADRLGPDCVTADKIPAGYKGFCHFQPIDFDTPNAMYPVLTARSSPMAYSPDTKYFYVAGSPAWPLWLHRFEDPRFFVGGNGGLPGIKTSGIMAAFDSRTNKIVWQKDTPYEMQNGAGFTATAGGLLFHGDPAGELQVLDAKTGDTLWKFQTGANESGPAAIYEIDGKQYVSVLATNVLWTFALGGKLPEAAAPPAPQTETTFGGRVVKATAVTLGGMIGDGGLVDKVREVPDEYSTLPMRIRVHTGDTVTWTNKGKQTHDATAQDGSWTTGPIAPGATGTVKFDKPGTWTYQSKAFPWMYGQVVVE